MARVAITVTSLVANTGTARPAGTTADDTEDHIIENCPPLEELLIEARNTAGAEYDVTIVAGDSPPALSAGQGDLVVPVAATSGVKVIGPLSSARFLQSDGSLLVNLEASFAGTLVAYHIPRTA